MASLRRAVFTAVPRLLSSSNSSSAATSDSLYRPILGLFSRVYSSNVCTQSIDFELSNEESKRRLFNRLMYRSKQRGYLELDLILGKWVEDHIHSMDENGIKSLVHVLDLENPDLWKWLTGQEQPPDTVNINPVFVAVRDKVMNNLSNHASRETRATPGQPWVRGWDDFKKGRDGPTAGNQ
ncbi:Succinate dehydrogenase assembly factor 2 [Forsythia ovata]|uniref:Succinate dehydrogenase assembly factor 2 n=1 Tax=Forsythia ovata TaxID=205694 RepID=A0ABD1TPC2_9LAMI